MRILQQKIRRANCMPSKPENGRCRRTLTGSGIKAEVYKGEYLGLYPYQVPSGL